MIAYKASFLFLSVNGLPAKAAAEVTFRVHNTWGMIAILGAWELWADRIVNSHSFVNRRN